MSDAPKTRDHLLIELRQEIAHVAWAAGVQCGIAQDYAAIGDDRGLEYSLRQLTAYVRSAAQAYNQLREIDPPSQIGGAS